MKNKNADVFSSIPEILQELREGRMIVLVDDENRENEGDLVIAAEKITPEAINFMVTHARGVICLALHEDDVKRLRLPMMPSHRASKNCAAYTTSIEAASGVTTGISAFDRARTIQVAIDPHASPDDIISPGHIFPVQARTGGVLERHGHTEGSVDLTRMAKLKPAAVICEIMNDDGTMARLPNLHAFAKKHHLKIASINDLIAYRLRHDVVVREVASSHLPLNNLPFIIKIFESEYDHNHHIALINEKVNFHEPVLVRIHSECFTGDVFGSSRCDCGWQLDTSLETISKEPGILLYLPQEGRGIGLVNKLKAYQLQDEGLDTVEANHRLGFAADQRDYAIAAHMLKKLGIKNIRLLTNNPHKIERMQSYGFEVTREPIEMPPHKENRDYLRAKRDKLGHLLNLE